MAFTKHEKAVIKVKQEQHGSNLHPSIGLQLLDIFDESTKNN